MAVNDQLHFEPRIRAFASDQGTKSAGPVRDAIATVELYKTSFNFAFPFDRSVLKNAFAKCAANPGTASACMQAKRESETKVGPID